MTLEIPTVRPPVLTYAVADDLRRLLAFRHFFRHAYTASFDGVQLAVLVSVCARLRGPLAHDLTVFDMFLERTAAALASG